VGLKGVESDGIERKRRVHLAPGFPEVLAEIRISLQGLAGPIEVDPRRLGLDFSDQKRERGLILRRLRAGVVAKAVVSS